MMLYIAEKPSLGRALADALPKPHKKGDGFITVGNGDIVSWCIGHLLEQAEPDAYDAKYKRWQKADLPILPPEWKLTVKPKTRKQFSTLKKLIQQAEQLVNVGDPDREGQLLIDEVIHHCKPPKAKVLSAKRCLINDLNPQAVKKALTQLKNNADFIPLSTSALARARADWLYGINMTRLCTIQGKASGFQGVLSIGRVQTPLLGLVVKRDAEIEQFVAKPFYELSVELITTPLNTAQKNNTPVPDTPYTFTAKWQPSEACRPYMDDDNRVLSRALVENVASRVIHQDGDITRVDSNIKKQAPPLPYNLSSLQIDAAKRFRLSAKQVLDSCQQLYEKYKLITYPRSDCRYLPGDHFTEAHSIIAAITHNTTSFSEALAHIDTSRRSKAWNDSKVSAHHAIIPTATSSSLGSLPTTERNIYTLIARQYLVQFLPSFDYRQIHIDTVIAGGTFIAKRKELINLGWRMLIPLKKPDNTTPNDHKDKEQDALSTSTMPDLQKGDTVHCTHTIISDKHTTPPKRFNDASLLSAMTGIARYVKDPEIRKVLRETDGLGTEATRAGIIELLFTREFLHRQGKDIIATDIGRQLIQSLPECVALPDMTAQWESQLNAISQKTLRYQQFMDPMMQTLQTLITDINDVRFERLAGKGKPFRAKKTYKKGGKKSSSASKGSIKKPAAPRRRSHKAIT